MINGNNINKDNVNVHDNMTSIKSIYLVHLFTDGLNLVEE